MPCGCQRHPHRYRGTNTRDLLRAEEKAKISSPQVAELKASGPGVYFPVVATEYGRFAPGTSAWLEFLQHHAVNKRFGVGGQASAAKGSWQAKRRPEAL